MERPTFPNADTHSNAMKPIGDKWIRVKGYGEKGIMLQFIESMMTMVNPYVSTENVFKDKYRWISQKQNINICHE